MTEPAPPTSPDHPSAADHTGADPSGDQRSDADLLQAHLSGDPSAFGTLVTRHRDRLWAVALRTMRNPEDAADALQDAYISAFRRAASFRGDSLVTTWLHRVVVNACLDRIRRNRVRAAEPLPEDPSSPELGRLEPPADPLEQQEQSAEVAGALNRLNPDQRAALVLVDMEGYSVEEAATMLGCAPGTVKSRCARGRARLAPLLAHLRVPADPVDARSDADPAGRRPGAPPPSPRSVGGAPPPVRHGTDPPLRRVQL